jgi:hypothetical protein
MRGVMDNNIRCVLVKPHMKPKIIKIGNNTGSFRSCIGGSYCILHVPELGNRIGLIIREEGKVFTPEKNRPLFDESGKLCGCIYGNFFAVGMEDEVFRSLTDKELIQVTRLYEQPYQIMIDEHNNHFVACIPEQPWDSEAESC